MWRLYIHVDIHQVDMCQIWDHMVCWYNGKFGCFRIAYVFCVLYVCVFALCLVYQMLSMFASSDLSNVYLQDC
jgi:hypothetical protein